MRGFSRFPATLSSSWRLKVPQTITTNAGWHRWMSTTEVTPANQPQIPGSIGYDNMFDLLLLPHKSGLGGRKEYLRKMAIDEKDYWKDKNPQNQSAYHELMLAQAAQYKPDQLHETFAKVQELFYGSLSADTYSAYIGACAKVGAVDAARAAFDSMESSGVSPTVWCYTGLLSCHMKRGQVHAALDVIRRTIHDGVVPDEVMYSALVKGYVKLDMIDDALTTFYWMQQRFDVDVVTWSTIISGFAQRGMAEKAKNFFDDMQQLGIQPTEVTFHALLNAYAKRLDYWKEAFDVIAQMQVRGFPLDEQTFNTVLMSTARSGNIDGCLKVIDAMKADGIQPTLVTQVTLLNGYAKALKHALNAKEEKEIFRAHEELWSTIVAENPNPGQVALCSRLNLFVEGNRLNRALEAFAEFSTYNVVPGIQAWTSLLKMFAKTKRVDELLATRTEMEAAGIALDDRAFRWVLEGLVRRGYAQSALDVCEEMLEKQMIPNAKTLQMFHTKCCQTAEISYVAPMVKKIIARYKKLESEKKQQRHKKDVTLHANLLGRDPMRFELDSDGIF